MFLLNGQPDTELMRLELWWGVAITPTMAGGFMTASYFLGFGYHLL